MASQDELNEYIRLRSRERLTPAETRRQLHIHYREAAAYERTLRAILARAIEQGGAGIFVPDDKTGDPEQEPIPYEDYSNEALEALEDFAIFRRRYFGRDETPWQSEAASLLSELLTSYHKEYIVVNCPPGSGKSTLFAHDIPLWLACRNRALRTLIGSYTERQAIQYIGRIRRTLQRKTPLSGAESTLIKDFGGFRPLQRDLWRVNEFIIAQQGETDYAEKEPSFAAFGFDSAFLGGRFDLIIWDDLVDKHVLRSRDALESMERWFGDEAETRCEPGGLFVLQGQRMAAGDLYRHALDLKLEDGTPKYHHICYKAHYEENCEKIHGQDAQPWPEGCLLDPVRVPWRELASKMRNAFGRYRTLFQQEDLDPERALLRQEWLEGGEHEGTYYPGCYDKTRKLGEWPLDHAAMVPVVTIDPSAVNKWGCILWAVDPRSDMRYVIDVYNDTMQVSDFLDYSYNTGDFSGLIERWWRKCDFESSRLMHVIVENNAAQRWLYQSRVAQQWGTQRGCQFIPHQSTLRKNDETFGVESLSPLFEFGRIRLPGRGENEVIQEFVKQLLQWPDGKYTDLVMSSWFLEAAWSRINFKRTGAAQLWTPSWMKSSTRGLNARL